MAEGPDQKVFAAWLSKRIAELPLSQADVARYVGTDGVQVMRWRRGESTPSPRFLAKLAELFGEDLVVLERLAYLPASSAQPASTQVDAERQLWRARYEYLMDKKVPRSLWEAYLAACEALADAYQSLHPGRVNTAESDALNASSPENGEGDPDDRGQKLTPSFPFGRRTQQFANAAH